MSVIVHAPRPVRYPHFFLLTSPGGRGHPDNARMQLPVLTRFHGVDFSGAKKAGDFIWVADVVPTKRRPGLALTALRSLTAVCGTAERAVALRRLVEMVLASEQALWGFDSPFALPLALFPKNMLWPDQFAFLSEWGDDAYGCGLECVRRATKLFDRMHVLRTSEAEVGTPFDTYHYRNKTSMQKIPISCDVWGLRNRTDCMIHHNLVSLLQGKLH